MTGSEQRWMHAVTERSSTPSDVIILGTGGNALDIVDSLLELNDRRNGAYRPLGFLDDDPAKRELKFLGLPVLGRLEDAPRFTEARFVNGIGSPANYLHKPEILARTGLSPERFLTIVHPSAEISRFARLGHGVTILQNVTVANGATVGDQVMILPNSIVSHDVRIGDLSCIAGGVCLSGGVEIGRNCYVGSNATVRQDLNVGDGALVGMAACVTVPVAPGATVVGNPARPAEPGDRN